MKRPDKIIKEAKGFYNNKRDITLTKAGVLCDYIEELETSIKLCSGSCRLPEDKQ